MTQDIQDSDEITEIVESYINGNTTHFEEWINTTTTKNVLLAIKLLDSLYQPLNTGIDIVLSLLD